MYIKFKKKMCSYQEIHESLELSPQLLTLDDRIWRSFIDNQKLPWMRIIFEWTAYYNQEWKEISRKLNVEMVKILAKTVNQLLSDGSN